MTGSSPLDLLISIDWGSLRHAYGEASDVPGQLRALLSADKEERADAQHALCGNIFHQGDRYEATAYAVPYLFKILEDSSTPERDFLIDHLVHLALGYAQMFLPNGVDLPAWREKASKILSPEYEVHYYRRHNDWIQKAETAEERVSRIESCNLSIQRDRRAAKYELLAYEVVRAGVSGFQKCLEDDDAQIRSWAAFALAWFPREADEDCRNSVPVLMRVLEQEKETAVLACTIIALGLLNGRFDGARPEEIDELVAGLRGYSADTRPLIQWATAVALVRLKYQGQEHIDMLIRCIKDPSFIPDEYRPEYSKETFPFIGPFDEEDVDGYSAKALGSINANEYPGVVTAVLDALSRSSGCVLSKLLKVLLTLTFGPMLEHKSDTAFEGLSELQKRTVTALAEMDDKLWNEEDFVWILRNWEIPARSRDECRTYVGLPGAGLG
ncbi:hypothetical protein BDV23DRAFT_193376 [Aspergillus alliaceus]|uniref:Armadillo-type protein n=1 Tax=Petromyces alliaceus TaxID=209559 RepID=A0A5N7CAZ2_PETAA|nr:hypothetical protein BDV23DRAFT_193376 [Aspergillus alliaceus]